MSEPSANVRPSFCSQGLPWGRRVSLVAPEQPVPIVVIADLHFN